MQASNHYRLSFGFLESHADTSTMSSTSSLRKPHFNYNVSPTRSLLGPLTTEFVPPSGCSNCFVPEGFDDDDCLAYSTDCLGDRACLPGPSSATAWWGFYSPGISCPSGWTTFTTFSQDERFTVGISSIIDLMEPEETAAFCCPR